MDRDLLLNHDESLYCGDDIVDFSENKVGTSPAAKQKDDSNFEENYSSEEKSDTCEQPAAEIQEA